MNHIYRTVWNAALGACVAVAENARGAGKTGSAHGGIGGGAVSSTGFTLKPACRAALALFAAVALACPQAYAANAADATVSSGAGSVATSGATTTINQTSQRLAIDWSKLSTAAGEALVFNQPNAQAIALNRIIGSNPSEFLGSLTANGQVFILNPNGVLFGAGSQVNVGGLVASTLSMSNADFQAGNHVFTGTGGSGAVVNQGAMTAAPGGYLALLAPEVRNEGVMTASLGTALLAAGNKVTLNLDNGSLLGYSIDQGAVNALAENRQLIKADGGQVLLSAKAMDALTSATVNNTGVIEARTLENKAGRIMLMGDMEHGTVNVGGTLDASAPNGGDGGFIETSAAHVKVASGTRVTTSAPNGQTGKWLIDPNDFTIAAIGGDMDAATVASNLASTNFEIQTATMGTTSGNGDIFVSENLSWSSANTLTLTAQRNIALNNSVTAASGGLTLNAAGNISAPAAVNVGTFTLANGNWSQNGALPAFSAADFRIAGGKFIRALGGNGVSAATAYQIADIYGLQGAGSAGMLDKSYRIVNNIDATGTAGWNSNGAMTPVYAGFKQIGTASSVFSGNLDGGNYTVNGLFINRPLDENVGLIGYSVSGTLKNLVLANVDITGGYNVGAMVGGTLGNPVQNILASGRVVATAGAAGGVVGFLRNGSLSASAMSGTVSGVNSVGGLVGYSGGSINNSYSTASVTASGDYAGGLVGRNAGSSISNSYATGAVTGGSNLGGLVGENTGTVAGSFWDTQTSGRSSSAGGTGKTTAEMKQQATFAGWDIDNAGGTGKVWRIYEGNTGPLLRSFLTGLTLGDTTVTYNGTTQSGATTALANVSGNAASGLNASGTPYASGYYSNQKGYDISGGKLTIDKVILTYSATAADKIYDGSTTAAATLSGLTGLVGAETVTATADATFNSKDVATANLVTVNSATLADGTNGGLASNYTITAGGTAVASITAKALTYSTAAANKTYDGTNTAAATLNGLTGLVGAETVTATANATFNSKDVAAASLVTVNTATLADGTNGGLASNYSIAGGGTAAASIAAKTLTYSTAAADKTYDGSAAATATVSNLAGFIGTETVSVAGNTASFNSKDVATANMVTVNSATLADGTNGGLASNYSIAAGGAAAANITAKALTYSTAAANKTYDGSTTATATLSGLTGLVGTETVGVSGNTATFNSKDVATANLVTVNSATLADGTNGGLASNYSIAAGGTAAASINAKALSYTTTAANKVYDGSTTATATLSGLTGLVGTETVTASSTGATFNGKDVTTASLVTVNSATLADGSNGGLASNYSIAAGGTAAAGITAKSLTYSTTAANKTYDGNATAAATLSGLGGFVGSETVAVSGNTASFNSKDVLTASTVTVNSATLADGTNGGLASNYSIAGGGTASASITAKALTYSTTAADKTYDGSTTAAATLVLTNLVGSETLGSTAGATFNSKDVLAANTVTINSATLADGTNGGLASNYSIAGGGTAAASINAKALSYNTAAANKTYDGSTTATATLSGLGGLVGSETVAVSGNTASFNSKDVLTASTVTVNSATLADGTNGGLASNYSIAGGGTAAASITAKALTYSAAAADKSYDGSTTAAATLVLTNLVGSETLGSTASASFNSKDVLTASTVTVNSATLADGTNGGLASNYSIAGGGTASASITAKALTYSTTAADKTYDGSTTAAATLVLTNLVGSETLGSTAGATFNSKDVLAANTVTINSATLADGTNGGLASNYSIAGGGTAAASINAKALSYNTAAANKTYDGSTTATATLSGLGGLVGSETVAVSGNTASFNSKDVLTASTVTVNSATLADGTNGGLASNYSIAGGGTAAASITAKALTYSTTAANKTYDGSTTAAATLSGLTGLVGGETVTASAGATFNTKDVTTANLVTVNSTTLADGTNGGLASNYSIAAGGAAAANITAKALTYSTAAANKTYDGSTTATATLSGLTGLVGTETVGVSGNTATFNSKDVATANLVTVNSATLADGTNGGLASNYSIAAGGTAAASINAKALSYTTTAANKVYDGSTTATATLSGLTGLVGTETVTASSTGATFNGKDVTTASLVTVNSATLADGSNGGLASNYSIAAGGTAAAGITAKALTYTTSVASKSYDGSTTASATLNLNGLVNTEALGSTADATFNSKDVLTANLVTVNSATLADGSNGGLASNYTIAGGGTAAANITAKALTYSTNASNKTYDGSTTATATLTGLTGLVGTETVTASSTGATFNSKDVATANLVTVNSATLADGTNGGLASNYSIAGGGTAAASIDAKALTYSTSAADKTYDGNTTAAATLSGLTGLVGTETLTASAGATFNSKDVLTASTVTVNSATLADGTNGGLASNYSIAAGGTASANILAKALTYTTAVASKTYDGSTAASATLNLNGLVNTETLGSTAGATFNSKDVLTANLVTVNSATLADGTNGGLASNYSIAAGGTAAASISAKALSYTTTAANKTYDGSTAATVILSGLTGLVGTETVTASSTGATFNSKDVATATLVTVNGAALADGTNGGLASNYSIAGSGTAAASITAKTLTYSTAAAGKIYDGNTTATATLSGLTGLVGTETVTASAGATFNSKDVATASLVTVNSATLVDGSNGGLAGNYSIAAGGTAAANITARDLTVTASGVNKVYDGSTAATVAYSDNRVAGDVLVVTGLASFADKNAGAGKAVGVNSIALGSTDAGNYNLLNTTATTSADITPASLSVTANNDSRFAGGTPYTGGNGVAYSGFVAGETSGVLGGALTYGGSSQGASSAGDYAITPGGYSSGNYAIRYVNGVLSITSGGAAEAALGGPALVAAYGGAVQAVASIGTTTVGTGGGAGGAGGNSAGGAGSAGGVAGSDAGALAAAAADTGSSSDNE